jgi:hypothetical protein
MVVKTFNLSLTTATPAKSEGLGKTSVGLSHTRPPFNRGFFDIILPTAHPLVSLSILYYRAFVKHLFKKSLAQNVPAASP